jgi:hypothetical protein
MSAATTVQPGATGPDENWNLKGGLAISASAATLGSPGVATMAMNRKAARLSNLLVMIVPLFSDLMANKIKVNKSP